MINGGTKYIKSHSQTSQIRSFLWKLLLPAAATVTTDVWIYTFTLSTHYNLILAIINVSGAFLDGFFSAFESGDAVPNGPKTEAVHLVAGEMRTFGLSTFTSWSGMINIAAGMGFARSNVLVGLAYILMCIGCGCVAHGLGSDLAQYISAPSSILDSATNLPYSPVPRAHKILDLWLLVVAIYIFTTYVYIQMTEPYQKFWTEKSPSNQLIASVIFAVGGAYTGNVVSKLSPKNTQIPIGTVLCNTTFSLLSLSMSLLGGINPLWSESLLLRAFSINFCGSASVFSRHISGLSLLYSKSNGRLVILNVMVNLILAATVYWIALEIEIVLHEAESNDDSMKSSDIQKAI